MEESPEKCEQQGDSYSERNNGTWITLVWSVEKRVYTDDSPHPNPSTLPTLPVAPPLRRQDTEDRT